MNNKGQALIEFILILPLFLFMIFAVVDFGFIFNSKNSLENDSADIIEMFKNGTSVVEIQNIYLDYSITVTNDNEYYRVLIESEVNLITPGFNRIFGDPYLISVERFVPYA